jgi:hypothetical protein
MNKNILSIVFVAISIFSLTWLSGMSGFSMDRYVNMATDQKILVTMNEGIGFLSAIFFMLLALYFKKDNKN